MAVEEKSFLDLAVQYGDLIWRRKWIIVAITGTVTLAAVIFSVISLMLPPEKSPLPNTYRAEAILFVASSSQSDISDSILTALGVPPQERQGSSFNTGDMLLEILRSRTILDQLVEEFGIVSRYKITSEVKTRSRTIMMNRLHLNFSRNTGSLRLSFSDIDPKFACDVVNRTVEVLSEWFIQNRGLLKEKTKQVLEEKLREVSEDINSIQCRLKELQRIYGVLDAEQLSASQAAALADLRSQLIMKEIEIKNYSTYSKVNDPRLEQLNEELQNLRDLISRNQMALPAVTQDIGKPRSIADVAQEFSQLANELDIQQRIYNTLSPQYEAAKLSSESESFFQVFELAEVPDVKTGPSRKELVIKAFAGSLVFSVVWVILLNMIPRMKEGYLERKKRLKSL